MDLKQKQALVFVADLSVIVGVACGANEDAVDVSGRRVREFIGNGLRELTVG